MPKNKYVSQFFIKINGQPAPVELMDDLIEIIVEDNLYLPDMFSIELHDKAMKWINSSLLSVKNPVEITAQASKQYSSGRETVLIQGEITGLEPDISSVGVPALVVRGYDRSYRLHQGRQTRSFLQSTDSEIAQKIAAEVGLKTDGIEGTTTINEHITQNNQTNMEFLGERAKRLGYQLYVKNETLYFCPDKHTMKQGPKLLWGENLLSFRPDMTTLHQVDEVIVRGWDPMTKKEVVGRANKSRRTPNVPGEGKVERGFKGSNQVVISRPVQSQEEAESIAQSLRDEMGGDSIQAEGTCMGNPDVKAGAMIEIAGMGKQFDGQYMVTSAIHTYHNQEGYETAFSIGGKRAQTLSSLLNQQSHDSDPGRGVRIGIVTNNQDPEELGRIKVKYPGVDDSDESPWLRIAAPMAGAQRGFYYLPEINDEVLVAFEQGDIHRPYMLGALWNGQDKPPQPSSAVLGGGGEVNRRIIRSRSGHEIVLDDTSGSETITISDKTGNNRIVINSVENKMLLEVAGNVDIKGSGNVSIKADGDLSIEANGKISIKGASIDLN